LTLLLLGAKIFAVLVSLFKLKLFLFYDFDGSWKYGLHLYLTLLISGENHSDMENDFTSCFFWLALLANENV